MVVEDWCITRGKLGTANTATVLAQQKLPSLHICLTNHIIIYISTLSVIIYIYNNIIDCRYSDVQMINLLIFQSKDMINTMPPIKLLDKTSPSVGSTFVTHFVDMILRSRARW